MLGNLDWYQKKVELALTGHEAAIAETGLDSLPSNKISKWRKVPDLMKLGASFGAAAEMAAAGRFMGYTSLERVNS